MPHPGRKQALPTLDSHLTHLLKGQSALVLSLKEKKKGFLKNLHFLRQKAEFPHKSTFKQHTHYFLYFLFCSFTCKQGNLLVKHNKIPRKNQIMNISHFVAKWHETLCDILCVKRQQQNKLSSCAISSKKTTDTQGQTQQWFKIAVNTATQKSTGWNIAHC